MNLFSFLDFRQRLGAARSSQWSAFQKSHIGTTCEVCGAKNKLLNPLNLHHVRPFHLHPELELDPTNMATLCRTCHFLFGHLKNWSSFNVTVKEDAKTMLIKIANRP